MLHSNSRVAGHHRHSCALATLLLLAPACETDPGPELGADSTETGEPAPPCPSAVLETSNSEVDAWGCAIAASDAEMLGVSLGDNVRVARFETDTEALYTVVELLDEQPGTLRMHPEGWARLGADAPFCGGITSVTAPAPLELADAKELGEFIESLDVPCPESDTLVLAPHGGAIEYGSDFVAEAIIEQWPGCAPSSWICRGWGDENIGAFDLWHVSSEDISAASFTAYESISAQHYERVISVHGHGGLDSQCGLAEDVVVGGAAPEPLLAELRVELAAALEELETPFSVRLQDAGEACTGTADDNVVNARSVCGGVQLELSMDIRSDPAAREVLAQTVARMMSSWPGCA